MWQIEYTLPEVPEDFFTTRADGKKISRTFFHPAPEEIKFFTQLPDFAHPVIAYLRERYEIPDTSHYALTFIEHTGELNLPPSTPGTGLRALIHSGEICQYKGILTATNPEIEYQLKFTLDDNKGIMLSKRECQNCRVSIRGKTDSRRRLWVIDFGIVKNSDL